MDVVQNILLVFYNGNYFYLNKKFTSLSSSLAARSTLGFTCLTLLWNMNLTKVKENMDLEWNSEKVLHEGLWRGGWNWPRGRSSEASLIFSEDKEHWGLEVYCMSSTGNDWMPEGCRSSQQNRLFAKCYTTRNIFTKQRYCQWNIKSTPEYWESAAWLPGWGLPRLRLFPLQLNTTAVGEAAGILCTSLCYLSSTVFSM